MIDIRVETFLLLCLFSSCLHFVFIIILFSFNFSFEFKSFWCHLIEEICRLHNIEEGKYNIKRSQNNNINTLIEKLSLFASCSNSNRNRENCGSTTNQTQERKYIHDFEFGY